MNSVASTRTFGVPLTTVCGLALLGVPRVIAHDLDLVGPTVNTVLVFAPFAAWVGYMWWRRVSDAFRALLAVGACYGVSLAVTHQILWTMAFDDPPRLGGTLEGQLSPVVEDVVLRVFSVGSSFVTGVLVGAVTGAIAWVLIRTTDRHRPR